MNIFRKQSGEEKFAETIEILRGLKKIQAPDNFEYNLMTRIQNQRFENLRSDRRGMRFTWVLPPAAAVGLTAIVLFFILTEQPIEADNPLLSPPTLIAEFQSSVTEHDKGPVEYIAEETSESRATAGGESVAARGYVASDGDNSYKVVLQANDVVVKEEVNLPFDNSNNVDLDSYIEGSGTARASSPNSRLVRGGYPVLNFNGFVVREKVDKETLEKYRNKLDSLKNASKQN